MHKLSHFSVIQTFGQTESILKNYIKKTIPESFHQNENYNKTNEKSLF